MTTRARVVVVALAATATLVLVVATVVLLLGRGDAETLTLVVPAGTGARLDAGEQVEVMPEEVNLEVGDTLVIRNDDDRAYVVGVYPVRPGETIRQTFRAPQTLVGACTLSGGGEFRIVVT